MFSHFFRRKFKMAAIFEIFLKSGCSIFLRYPGGGKFRRNRSISNGEGDRGIFVFLHFFDENSKWPPFLKIFQNQCEGVENFDEIALSLTVKEIEAILCFRTFSKNSKIQNGCNFLKICQKWV